MIKEITRAEYAEAYRQFRLWDHERAAMVDPMPLGTLYHDDTINLYFGVNTTYIHGGRKSAELTGVFKRSPAKGGAEVILEELKRQGYRWVDLFAFEPAAKAWWLAGFNIQERVPFVPTLAPATWLDSYGTPAVYHMRKVL